MRRVEFDFHETVAIVTGAASGIGHGIASLLLDAGASVGCVDLPGAGLDEAVRELSRNSSKVLSLPADVTNPDSLSSTIAAAEDKLGPLSLGVNAAGVASSAKAEDMSLAQWNTVLDVDLTGVFLSCQAEARAMIRNGGGAIVNIASMSATIANRGLHQAHYNSAKAGVVQLSRSLAWEWAPHGIRVNAVSPGYTYTPMTKRPEQVDAMSGYALDTPLGRNAEPTDIAGPAAFLLSDGAGFITGVDLLVDGGHVIW